MHSCCQPEAMLKESAVKLTGDKSGPNRVGNGGKFAASLQRDRTVL